MSASHGNTPAAWTAVSIMFVGFLISGIALPLELEWLFFVGLAVVVLGAVVGKVMSMMGMGSTVTYKDEPRPGVRRPEGDQRERLRRHPADPNNAGPEPAETSRTRTSPRPAGSTGASPSQPRRPARRPGQGDPGYGTRSSASRSQQPPYGQQPAATASRSTASRQYGQPAYGQPDRRAAAELPGLGDPVDPVLLPAARHRVDRLRRTGQREVGRPVTSPAPRSRQRRRRSSRSGRRSPAWSWSCSTSC